MYLPPIEYLTWSFIAGFLDGSKILLHKSKVNYVQNVPKLNALPCDHIWDLVRQDKQLMCYFDVGSARYPGKQYLLDVS